MTTTAQPYYTLCVWIPGDDTDDPGCWSDEFGSYSRREVEGEKDFAHNHQPRGWVKIVKHPDTTTAMIAARDALPSPKGGRA